MKVYALSDLHLSYSVNKPMDIFGDNWDNHCEKILANWNAKVTPEDVVLIAGDISWAMQLRETAEDFNMLRRLKGRKVILRGNHDYWWSSYNKVLSVLTEGTFAVQNNCVRVDNLLAAGSRGWMLPNSARFTDTDRAIYEREKLRLTMSLKAMQAMRREGDKVIVMTHYPPFDATLRDSEITEIIAEYTPDAVVYGHLHGKDCRAESVVNKNGIPYYLTSSDMVGHDPVSVLEC